MYGIGSTITATQWPRFYHGNKCHTLPRLHKSCKPYEPGWILMRKNWFIDLVNLMEPQVLDFLETSTKTPYVSQVLSELEEVKRNVPKYLRLSTTFFTQVSIVTSNGKKDMKIHVNEGDIINDIYHLEELGSDESTLYFEMDGKTGILRGKHKIPFQHVECKLVFKVKYTIVLNHMMEFVLL